MNTIFNVAMSARLNRLRVPLPHMLKLIVEKQEHRKTGWIDTGTQFFAREEEAGCDRGIKMSLEPFNTTSGFTEKTHLASMTLFRCKFCNSI